MDKIIITGKLSREQFDYLCQTPLSDEQTLGFVGCIINSGNKPFELGTVTINQNQYIDNITCDKKDLK